MNHRQVSWRSRRCQRPGPGGLRPHTGPPGGMAKAAASRGLPNYLVNSYGGDSYGLGQVCSNSHYVGSWYLDPAGWGPVLLSLEMNEMNGVQIPQVTNIAGYEVTAKTAFLHCK